MATFLLFDINNLAYRAFHSIPGLKSGEVGTSVMFGVLRDMLRARQQFGPDSVPVCCFDFGANKRKQLLPTYKSKREELTDEERAIKQEINAQIHEMREHYLPEAGFKNVLYDCGYEADDCVASVALNVAPHDDAIIFSNDQDFYQLLRENVHILSPGKEKCYTAAAFTREWGMQPPTWAKVKAIAGCGSDDVVGVEGVGEKTAAKFINRTLPKTHKTYAKIQEAKARCLFNYKLVRLPLPGVQTFDLSRSPYNMHRIGEVAASLGMTTLLR